MKKVALVVALVLGFAVVGAGTASAKDMSGRLGVGADSTLGWGYVAQDSAMGPMNQGLSIVYQVSKMFGLQLIASVGFGMASDDDVDYSANYWGVSVRGLVPIAFTNDVNLNAVVGFSVAGSGWAMESEAGDVDGSKTHIWFDLGLRPEWFITDHFSIHTQVGVAISLLNEDNIGLEDGSGVSFNIFGNPHLLGNAGFTFYF